MSHSPYLVEVPEEGEGLYWKLRGACRGDDPEKFFPSRGAGEFAREAKKVCRECPVVTDCGEWALVHDERFGVWGGMTQRELKALRKLMADRRITMPSGHGRPLSIVS